MQVAMGFSLEGLYPSSKKGARIGPWSSFAWAPLWDLCCNLGGDGLIGKKLARAGQQNIAAEVEATTAVRLAERLTALINLKIPEAMEKTFRQAGHAQGAVTIDAKGHLVDKKGKTQTAEQCAMFTAKDVRDLRDFMRDSGGFIIG
jgi:hypothetical protein